MSKDIRIDSGIPEKGFARAEPDFLLFKIKNSLLFLNLKRNI